MQKTKKITMRKTNKHTYPNESFLFFTNLRKHFIKRGAGERLDRYFRTNLLKRTISKRKDMYALLSNAMLASTPFIRLKAKKRRKYTIYKVHIPTKEWSRRKGVGSFAKSVKENLLKDLFASIEKQLIHVKTGRSNVENNRNDYHKLALKVTPYKWKKLLYSKKKGKKRPPTSKLVYPSKINSKTYLMEDPFGNKTKKPTKIKERKLSKNRILTGMKSKKRPSISTQAYYSRKAHRKQKLKLSIIKTKN
jgi:hypothetical protein